MEESARQLALGLRPKPRWGGRRENAGRPRSAKPHVPHACRETFDRPRPCHVTLKVRRNVASLRSPRVVRAIEVAFAAGCERGSFRLVHYSIQRDHAHLIVEADGTRKLGRGMKSLAARFARAVNRALRRAGPVLKERYHLAVLDSPRQVRNALAYVLLNLRKHLAQRGVRVPVALRDDASSARWFDGWLRGRPPDPPSPGRLRPVALARTWLLTTGWRRHGLVDPAEVPGA